MFGWSTAFLISIICLIHFSHTPIHSDKSSLDPNLSSDQIAKIVDSTGGSVRTTTAWKRRKELWPAPGNLPLGEKDGKTRDIRNREIRLLQGAIVSNETVRQNKINALTAKIESLEKDKDWFKKTILRLGTSDTNSIILGTNFNPFCLLGDLINKEKSPDWNPHVFRALETWPEDKELWQKWSNIFNSREKHGEEDGPEAAKMFYMENKAAMDLGGKSLWLEKWSVYELMVENELDPVVFSSERQNMPIDPKTQIFRWDELHFWSNDYKCYEDLLKNTSGDVSYFGSCDPAMGGDYTAIIVLMRDDKTNIFYVIEASIIRRSVDDALNDIVAYAKRFDFTKFIVESNNFQYLMVKQLEDRCKQKNVRLNLDSLNSTSHKKERIRSMQSFTRTGALKFSKAHKILLEQLCFFPMHGNDDGPDALEMALTAAQSPGKVQVMIVGGRDNSWIRDYRENFGWNI